MVVGFSYSEGDHSQEHKCSGVCTGTLPHSVILRGTVCTQKEKHVIVLQLWAWDQPLTWRARKIPVTYHQPEKFIMFHDLQVISNLPTFHHLFNVSFGILQSSGNHKAQPATLISVYSVYKTHGLLTRHKRLANEKLATRRYPEWQKCNLASKPVTRGKRMKTWKK